MRMCYADALNLVNVCVENGVLTELEGNCVAIYHEASDTMPAGFYADPKDEVAHELMEDEEGQKYLIDALAAKGVSFSRKYENEILPQMDELIAVFKCDRRE